MATANDPIVYATNAYVLKAAVQGTAPTTIINPPTPITTTTTTTR
jgi:polysaccharide export outer membrane protein